MRNGFVVAGAVAAMFIAVGCGSDDPADDTNEATSEVKCEGVNECKGTSECAGTDGSNECQGLNECKGQGWVTVPSAEDCTSQGGMVIG